MRLSSGVIRIHSYYNPAPEVVTKLQHKKLLLAYRNQRYTFLTDVFWLEVGEQVLLARVKVVQHGVWDGDDTVASAGALAVDVM